MAGIKPRGDDGPIRASWFARKIATYKTEVLEDRGLFPMTVTKHPEVPHEGDFRHELGLGMPRSETA
jgi:hypothetical protein